MSSPTWTPDALRSEAAPLAGTAWRLVEAQHVVATQKLVDSLDEQELLEDILEEAKPPVPVACAHLDYLLSTPFRYRPYPHGSRFRRAGLTPGVWYGAEAAETSVAEMVFYRYLFHAESPETPFPLNPAQYSAMAVHLATETALDLTNSALARDADHWRHPTEYGACQDLAEALRGIGGEVIRYGSVRDPAGGAALAVLSCAAFAEPRPHALTTWRVRMTPDRAIATCDFPRARVEFPRAAFTSDPRLA